MNDLKKAKAQLIRELGTLRQRVATLETAEKAHKGESKTLREREQYYRRLVESSLGLICVHDLEGVVLFVNPAAARALGYSPREGVGKNMREFLAPSVRHLFDEYLERIRRNPTARGLMCMITKNREERVWAYQNVRYEEPGKPPYVLGHAQDITEYERAKEALRKSEERFRNLIEGSIQGILIHRDFKPLFVNQAYVDIFGYATPHDILRMDTILPLIAPHERDRLTQYKNARLQGEHSPTHYEYQGVRQEGDLVWLNNMVKVVDWGGEVAIQATVVDITERRWAEEALMQAHANLETQVRQRTAALHASNKQLQQEITERKRAEEALRESEERYRGLFEIANDIVYTHDLEGNFTSINQAAERICGYTRDEALRLNIVDVIAQEYLELSRQMIDRKLAGTASTTYELEIIAKEGQRVPLEVSSQLIFQNGKPVEVLGIARDITERKRLENRLRQTQKMEAIGTLAGGIAHDFNNVLYAILGFTELALGDVPLHSSAWDALQEVLTAGKRAKDLVRQILTFSRQNPPESHPIRLQPIIQETLKLLRGSLPSTIDIHTHFAATSGVILANPVQMQQVLMNLCSNAAYAMRATGGVLEVRLESVNVTPACTMTHPGLQLGPHLRLTVRDTGPGMPPEVLTRLFEPFFTTKASGEGTGMGLAVTHGIITSHGGTITVASTPEQGTTFEIYLSQIEESAIEEARPEEPLLGEGEHILFVDDEEALTRLAQSMLERLGYKVQVYTNSAEALARFRLAPHCFDLVITDQTMPHMTGEMLARELRRIRPDIPIILCTGFSHRMDADQTETLEVDAFCLKPLQFQDIVLTISRVMAQRERN